MTQRWTRRALLAGTAASLGALAGCGGSDGGGTYGSGRDGGSDSGDETDGSGSEPDGTDDDSELDLREANVTGVAIEDRGDGEYRFDVTLYHDDDGEDGYANWWQVETLDGEQLARRELLHAHGTEAFTRSETVAIPDGVDCVVVRGHDQTHGYGGQAMLVSIPDGATAARAQGTDRTSFGGTDCP